MKKQRIIVMLCLIVMVSGIYSYQISQSRTVETVDLMKDENKTFIQWVEFNVTCDAMKQAYEYDVKTYGEKIHLNWVELLAYLGAKYGGDFSNYQSKDMKEIADLLVEGKISVNEL